jgi:hypothetical protein
MPEDAGDEQSTGTNKKPRADTKKAKKKKVRFQIPDLLASLVV